MILLPISGLCLYKARTQALTTINFNPQKKTRITNIFEYLNNCQSFLPPKYQTNQENYNKEGQFISSMANQPQVCITGFSSDPKIQDYQKYIANLNCKYAKKMTQTTQLLIVGCTATEKYKKAKLSREPITCVTLDWLLESRKKKKILPYSNFPVNHIFYGVQVCIFGFNNQQKEVLKKVLVQNGAHVKNLPNIGQLLQFDEDAGEYYDCAITTKRQFQQLGNIASRVRTPIVSIEWIEKSLLRKNCKWPKDYALNYQYLQMHEPKNLQIQIPKLNNQLKLFLEKDLNDTEFQFLSKVKIFIDQGIHYRVSSLMKKIVCACGGLYLNHLSPMVTHVIICSLDETTNNKYLKYGNIVKIVRAEWLIDSVHLFKKMDEQDYLVRQFASKHTRQYIDSSQNRIQTSSYNTSPIFANANTTQNVVTQNNIGLHSGMNVFGGYNTTSVASLNLNQVNGVVKGPNIQNSLNPISFGVNGLSAGKNQNINVKFINNPQHLSRQLSRTSISMSAQNLDQRKKQIQNIKAVYKSQIFKGYNFYIDNSQKKQTQMHHLGTKIRENGGILWDSIRSHDKQFFIVLKDSQDNPNILKSLSKYKENSISVSYRWIYHCIKNQSYIPPNSPNYYIFRPLPIKTPNSEFHSLKFAILGKEQSCRKRLIELLQVLGSKVVSAKKAELTHCICQDGEFKKMAKYEQIKNANDKVVFVRQQWIFECINRKKLVQTVQFQCQI